MRAATSRESEVIGPKPKVRNKREKPDPVHVGQAVHVIHAKRETGGKQEEREGLKAAGIPPDGEGCFPRKILSRNRRRQGKLES